MKSVWTGILAIVLIACQSNTQQQTEIKTLTDSISYSIGMDIAKNLKQQDIEVNPDALARGFKDASTGGKTLLTDQQATEMKMALQRNMMAKAQEKNKGIGEKNKKEGEAFLAENKKKADVKSTASGLQYKVITMGTGPKPRADQTVTVHYRGTLIDGTVFDSSFDRGEPATFPLNGVISGWTEALQLMPVGSKWEIYLPSHLAYGESGAGGEIGPNATLIFEVELLSIN